MSLRSPLARVRHLGSAHDGTAHWWAQRLTALALVPLVVWFVVSVISLIGADYESFSEWAANPISGALLVLLVVATFHHAQLGLQVVIEDYVHGEACKMAALLVMKAACLLLGVIALLSVLSLMF